MVMGKRCCGKMEKEVVQAESENEDDWVRETLADEENGPIVDK